MTTSAHEPAASSRRAHDARPAVELPIDHELQTRASWLIRLRWVAGIALVLASVVGLPLVAGPRPHLALAGVGAAVLGYNVVLWEALRRKGAWAAHRHGVHGQVALDWMALAASVALTGGIYSPLAVAFVFHLLIGAILLAPRTCYALTIIAIVLTGGLAIATPIPDITFEPLAGIAQDAARLVRLEVWIALSGLFLVTTYLATSITSKLRAREQALAESERSLGDAYRGMEALHEVGQVVSASLDLDEVLARIAEHATHLLGGRAASIRLLDATGRTLVVAGSYGLSQAYVEKGPVDVVRSQVDAQAMMGGIVEVPDVTNDSRFQYPEEARREGLRSMLCSAMRAKGRTLGVLRVYTAEPREFDKADDRLLSNLANLGAVAIENARAYGALQAMDQERIWFARTTHHQLRAPLAAVQIAIDALPFAGPVNDAQADLVQRARRRLQDAFDMVRDLLDLAAAQRLERHDPPEPVRLDFALERVLATMSDRARAKGLDVEVALDVAGWHLPAGAADLDRIFANLLDNAVKYTRHGRIAFRAQGHDGWVDAEVEDTGMGIAPEDLSRVFESFYRASAAKESGEMGTGLGLAIVRQLVTRLGGTIAVESVAGHGTTVRVRLPAIPAHPDGGAESRNAASRPQGAVADTRAPSPKPPRP